MKRLFFMVLGLGLFFCAMTSAAQAQATRTWVSGLGDDANPCSRTAPCKTFPGAYSRTAVGGEIDVIDPGGFGTINIGHSITIDGGGGVMASILAAGNVPAIQVNAGTTDDIILRNLTLTGVKDYISPGTSGVVINAVRQVSIEHCVIENFPQYGVVMTAPSGAKLIIANTEINYAGTAGVSVGSSSGVTAATISNSQVVLSGSGIQAHTNVGIQVFESTIANNQAGDGLLADGGAFSSITARSSTITENNVGAHAVSGGTVRLGRNVITYNNTGVLSDGVGKVQSWGDNHQAGNTVPGVPDGPALTFY